MSHRTFVPQPMQRSRINRKPEDQDLCHPGDLLKNRWEIISKLGAGGFGQIYVAKDRLINNVLVAVKVESAARKEKAQLPMELVILRRYQSFPHAVQLYGAGTHNGVMYYIVMQLLGQNLAKLRRLMKEPQSFSLATSMRLGIQCFEALRDIHSLGALHRDVKPVTSNFAMGPPNTIHKNKVYILDFGLSRFQTDLAGNIIPPKSEASFQGTLRYCSIATHMHRDIGRKDDFISYFYMLIEFLKGSLPWKDITNPREVLKCKEKFTLERLSADYPVQLQYFASHINSLKYADRPSYPDLLILLQTVVSENSIDTNGKWDWDYQELVVETRSQLRTE